MLGGLAPTNRHPPLILSVLRADEVVRNFDSDFEARFLEKLTYMGPDFTDGVVTLGRSSMLRGGRNLKNGYFDRALIGVDGERVKEGVIDRGWDVVPVLVKSHTAEIVSEINFRGDPGAWREIWQRFVRD